MATEIALPCPCGKTGLGHYAAGGNGKGQTDPNAREDAIQNAVGNIMMLVPWVDCTGKCEAVFTVDIRSPSGVTATKIAQNDFAATAYLRAEVSVECVNREVELGGHVVLVRHGLLPPHPGSDEN
jgi:hypothetical protein